MEPGLTLALTGRRFAWWILSSPEIGTVIFLSFNIKWRLNCFFIFFYAAANCSWSDGQETENGLLLTARSPNYRRSDIKGRPILADIWKNKYDFKWDDDAINILPTSHNYVREWPKIFCINRSTFEIYCCDWVIRANLVRIRVAVLSRPASNEGCLIQLAKSVLILVFMAHHIFRNSAH